MVLCRRCAHVARPNALSCPRCGYALPYWRSRRWRPRLGAAGATGGKDCPRCGAQTARQRSPLWVRPIRLLTLHHCSYRVCVACSWHGLAFHARTSPRDRTRAA